MKKFEYTELVYGAYGVKCPQDKEDYKPTSTIITGYLLNEMGKEGWEMCGCDCDDTWNRYYFKREIEE
jgi:hypothetical protein